MNNKEKIGRHNKKNERKRMLEKIRKDGRMNAWMHGCKEGWTHGCIDE